MPKSVRSTLMCSSTNPSACSAKIVHAVSRSPTNSLALASATAHASAWSIGSTLTQLWVTTQEKMPRCGSTLPPIWWIHCAASQVGRYSMSHNGSWTPSRVLRAVNSVDQLASFEFASTSISNALRRVLRALKPGISEIEAMRAGQHPGLPNSMHPIVISGPRASLGLASPSMRRIQLGDPVSCALGVWGALNSRAGFLVHDASELPAAIQDYVERLIKPYFAAITEWYSTVGIGVPGGEMYALVMRHLGDPFFGIGLNPGHLIHLDEWVNSPIFSGSTQELRAGMALQVDVIPATHSPYFTSNIEDGIALADEPMRQAFATRWPEAWGRIQARRDFMQNDSASSSNQRCCLSPTLARTSPLICSVQIWPCAAQMVSLQRYSVGLNRLASPPQTLQGER